jgi:hypothetical protein
MTRPHRSSLTVVPLLALALLGCFRADDENTNEGVDPSPGQVVVEIELTDDGIVMNEEIAAGDLVFEVTNSGEQPHGFAVEGLDGGLDSLLTNQRETLALTLEPGTYVAYSPVEGDRDAGHEFEFTTVEMAEETGAPIEEGIEPGEYGGEEDTAP